MKPLIGEKAIEFFNNLAKTHPSYSNDPAGLLMTLSRSGKYATMCQKNTEHLRKTNDETTNR